MKPFLFASFFALCAAAIYGCAPEEPEEKIAPQIAMTANKKTLVEGYNALGFSLLRQRVAENRTQNSLISPISIASALATLQGGAAGATQQEIARVLGNAKLGEKTREAESFALLNFLKNSPGVELSLANSLWVRKGFAINADFQNRTEKTYDAKVAHLDFASPSAPQEINDWVRASTRGKINRMIEQLLPEDRLVLMNAVYFQGNWLEKFDPKNTSDASFFAPAGKIQVPMMWRNSEFFHYAENSELQAVALPYKGNRLALYLLLPQKNKDVNTFLSSLNAEKFDALAKSLVRRKGSVSLPRFKMDDDINLIPPLQSLGMNAAFSNADFSRIAPPPPSLFISAGRHKATIEVNETGTEAAAATAITAAAGAAARDKPEPFIFLANRPFLLALRDDQSGALLFLGIVNSPEVTQ